MREITPPPPDAVWAAAEGDRVYSLEPLALEYRGRWFAAEVIASRFGLALAPVDPDQLYPPDAIVWVTYDPGPGPHTS